MIDRKVVLKSDPAIRFNQQNRETLLRIHCHNSSIICYFLCSLCFSNTYCIQVSISVDISVTKHHASVKIYTVKYSFGVDTKMRHCQNLKKNNMPGKEYYTCTWTTRRSFGEALDSQTLATLLTSPGSAALGVDALLDAVPVWFSDAKFVEQVACWDTITSDITLDIKPEKLLRLLYVT